MVKKPPANAGDARDTGSTLGQEDPLGKEMQPTPVFLPGEFHGQRSLAGCSPWHCNESDVTEATCQASRGDPLERRGVHSQPEGKPWEDILWGIPPVSSLSFLTRTFCSGPH